MKRLNRQNGISLVEILVALVISLFLLAGIVQVYTGNRATFSFTSALAEIQENGRFALDAMSQDLRLIGDWGCVTFDDTDTSNFNDNLPGMAGYVANLHDFLGEEAIEGTEGGGLNGSDSLTLRGGKPGQANVQADVGTSAFAGAGAARLFTSKIRSIGGGDIILVARCGANDLLIPAEADILQVTSIDNTNPLQTQINLGSNKSQQYENDAVVIELQTVTYSIAAGASGEPALWRSEFGVAQELVEGVEEMQVLYGIDSDSDRFPNQYVTANNVPDFDDVVSLRIALLVRSIDDFVTEDPQTYTFNGVTTTPADRRIRQVFSTTIALRNRIGSS